MILCASIVGTFLFSIKKYCNLNDFNKEFVTLTSFLRFFSFPCIRCSLRSRLCLCSAKFLYRMGSAYRLHLRTCYTKKEPPRRISEVLKVAATYSPAKQCSTIGDAGCGGGSAASPPPPARRRRAQPTPHPPCLSATHSVSLSQLFMRCASHGCWIGAHAYDYFLYLCLLLIISIADLLLVPFFT